MAPRTTMLALAAALCFTGCVPTSGGHGDDDRPDRALPALDAAPEPAPDAAEPDAAEPEPEPEPDAAEPEPEPDAAVESGPRVTVATFNAHRFFDTVCDSGDCGPDDYERQYPPAEFDAKAQTIAYGVRTLDADVVLLQEIESQESLDGLLAHLDGYRVAVIGELGFPASLDTVILARGAGLVRVVRHQDERIPRPRGGTTTFSRELLELHLDVDGHLVIAVCGHFKAKVDDDADRRQAEARAAREILIAAAAAHPDALIVFGGDLNDTPDSPPIRDLMGGGGLVRVAAELGDGDATYAWEDEGQAIDHLFLVETDAGRFIDGTARVVRDGDRGLARSDHAGLRATFTFSE